MYEIKKQNVHILCTEKYLSNLYLNQKTSVHVCQHRKFKKEDNGYCFSNTSVCFSFYSTLRFAIVT